MTARPGRLAGGIRALALGLLPAALVLSHRNLVVVLVLVALTGLTALRPLRPRTWRVPGWVWPLLVLTGYLALSSAWTPSVDDRDWALRIPLVALLVAAAIAAARTAGPGEARTFGLAVLAACLLLGVEGLTGGAIRDLLPPAGAPDRDDVATARGVGLAVLLLPAGIACLAGGRAGRPLAILMAASVLVGALAFDVAANAIALAAAGGAAVLAWLAPRGAPSALLVALAAAFLAAPLASLLLPDAAILEGLTEGPASWRQRLVIWRTVADAASADAATLLLGAGQHASAALGEAAGSYDAPGAPLPLPRVPTHPHSVFLQVWYEAGALGSLLAAAGAVLAARSLSRARLPRPVPVAAAATLGAALVFLAVDASLWTLWRGAALALAAYGLVLAGGGVVRRPPTR